MILSRAIVTTAAQALYQESGRKHLVCTVLGSGLSRWATALTSTIEINPAKIPNWPQPTVVGHAGRIFSTVVDEVPVLLLAGRVHSNEYVDGGLAQVTLPVAAAVAHGCKVVFLTNAAGSVNLEYQLGDFALISDHVNLTGLSPFVGPVPDPHEPLVPYFPDMTEIYSAALQAKVRAAIQDRQPGLRIQQGVYGWTRGREYETPATIRMLQAIGVDLVGMSTVPEAMMAHAMGAQVLGMSLVTNLGVGIGAGTLDHAEVTEMANAQYGNFVSLMGIVLPLLVEEAKKTR